MSAEPFGPDDTGPPQVSADDLGPAPTVIDDGLTTFIPSSHGPAGEQVESSVHIQPGPAANIQTEPVDSDNNLLGSTPPPEPSEY